MTRRSKNNPLTYNLERFRASHFDHRSLKRYKTKFPRVRELKRWSPNYDIHLIGMDLLVSKGNWVIDSLHEHLGNQLDESELQQLESAMRSVYGIYVDERWIYRKPFKLPRQVVVFTENPRYNVEQFCKLLLDESGSLVAFLSTKDRFEAMLAFYFEEMNTSLRIKSAFQNYIEETFYPCFEQVEAQSLLPQIVYGFSSTLAFKEQLTPMMLLHELAEALTALFNESESVDIRELVEDDEGNIVIVPRFSSENLGKKIVPQLIERREVIIEFFTRYLVNGEVTLKDIMSKELSLRQDEILMFVDDMNEMFSKVINHFLDFNAPLFMRI